MFQPRRAIEPQGEIPAGFFCRQAKGPAGVTSAAEFVSWAEINDASTRSRHEYVKSMLP
jgi:hypothetical protein